MSETTADFLLTRLHDNGVRRIYGYPGDGINAIVGALERHKDKIEFIQVRHEEMAAFMACAHAKFTGEVGVCLATSGPGAIHLLNGLYDAKLDHAPVAGDRRPAGADGARRPLPAGGRPADALQGRRARVLRDGDRARAGAAPRRPCAPDRARPAQRHLHHRPERPRREAGRSDAAEQARHDPLVAGLLAAAHRSAGRGSEARRRGAERRREGRDPRRPGCDRRTRGGRGRRAQARRRRREGAARQDRARRLAAVRHRLDRPARHEAELGHDAGLRHAADGRLVLPLLRVPAEGRAGTRRADRHRRPHAEHPLPDGGRPRRRREDDARRAAAAAPAQARARSGAKASRRTSSTGGS